MSHATEPARALRSAALLAVLALGLALRWTTLAQVEDLRPWPDALEYEEAARSLHEGRGYLLWIADRGYPPRYPPGLSLLIAATLPLVGDAPGSGIAVVVASALATIAGTYVLGRGAAGFACGIVAALLVAVAPLHVQWSRAVMSDVPASAAVVWLAVGILRAVRGGAGAASLLGLGVLCGLGASIRPTVLCVLPAGAAVVWLLALGDRRTRARAVLALGTGGLLGLLPLAWLNAQLFGSPLRSGYGYWVSDEIASLAWAFASRAGGAPSNAWFYGSLLLGGGTLYPPSAALLLGLGTLAAWRRERRVRALILLAWLTVALLVVLHLTFVWQWDRFLLPGLPLLAAVMALPCAQGNDRRLRFSGAALLAATLVVAVVRRVSFAPPNPPAHDAATLAKIAAIAEPDAAILARSNPFLFARLLRDGADRVWVPLQLDPHALAIEHAHLAPVRHDASGHGWLRAPLRQPFAAQAALAVVEDLCREGRPVYLSMQLDLYVEFLARLKETLAGRFALTQVVAPEPYAVYRVGCAGLGNRTIPDR